MGRTDGKATEITPEAVAIWLRQLDRAKLHDEGWVEVNQRYHAITRAVRPFIQQNFDTPEDKAAAFDGLTLALLTMGHFDDIQKLSPLFKELSTKER